MRSKNERVDKRFAEEMKNIMRTRIERGLAKLKMQDISMPESTRLIMSTPSWVKVKDEAKKLPKKK